MNKPYLLVSDCDFREMHLKAEISGSRSFGFDTMPPDALKMVEADALKALSDKSWHPPEAGFVKAITYYKCFYRIDWYIK